MGTFIGPRILLIKTHTIAAYECQQVSSLVVFLVAYGLIG